MCRENWSQELKLVRTQMHQLGAPLATADVNRRKGKGSVFGGYKPKYYRGKSAK